MNDRFIEALKRLQSQINEKNAQNKEKCTFWEKNQIMTLKHKNYILGLKMEK